jgi:two-component system response regulator
MNPDDEIEILLVEDNPGDAEIALRALRKNHLANRVHHVEDGEAALDFILSSNGALKVVLLDLKLPRVDGLEVLEKVKSDPRTKTIPVVVLTSSTEDRDIARCYELGVNSYIAKPVDFHKLADAVSQLGLYWLILNRPPIRG